MERDSRGIFISQIFILLVISALLLLRWADIPEESSVLNVFKGYSIEYGPYERIDINSAGIDKLKMIPGVGDVLAERIIEFRGKNGSFSHSNDLEKVNGIGKKKTEVLDKFVIFK